MSGGRGKDLQKLRTELPERSFAHMYETGSMRRTHLKSQKNILKRLLFHAVGFNLALLIRKSSGTGKPRILQGSSLSISLLHAFGKSICAARSLFTVLGQLRSAVRYLEASTTGLLGRRVNARSYGPKSVLWLPVSFDYPKRVEKIEQNSAVISPGSPASRSGR
jgi:hypothetical protein